MASTATRTRSEQDRETERERARAAWLLTRFASVPRASWAALRTAPSSGLRRALWAALRIAPSSGLRRALWAALRTAPSSGLAFVGLCALALVAYLTLRTYPNYDSLYALLWGRALAHGQLPDVHVYRAPTEHPLAIAFGALCSLFGQAGPRLLVLGSVASFVALVAGVYRLAQLSFGRVVALVAALLMLSRFFVESLALQGYLDVPYTALVVWAAALESGRPRRGWPVLGLLFAAGLLRPEAWLLGAAYWLWLVWPSVSSRRQLARIVFARTPLRRSLGQLALVAPGGLALRRSLGQLALVVLAPALWMGLDALLSGDPLHSLRSTAGLAHALGRTQALGGVVASTWSYAVRIDKLPVVIGALAGIGAALRIAPRRALLPVALLACLLLSFVAEGALGAPVLDRYMVCAAVVTVLFCAVALGGWSLLERGSGIRRAWIGIGAALVLYGLADVNSSLTLRGLRDTLAYHEELDSGLAAALRSPAVRRSIAGCKLVSLPNNKLVPDALWLVSSEQRVAVVARSQAREQAASGSPALWLRLRQGSVAVFPRRLTHFFDAVAGVGEGPLAIRPPAGFRAIYESRTYDVYANC